MRGGIRTHAGLTSNSFGDYRLQPLGYPHVWWTRPAALPVSFRQVLGWLRGAGCSVRFELQAHELGTHVYNLFR